MRLVATIALFLIIQSAQAQIIRDSEAEGLLNDIAAPLLEAAGLSPDYVNIRLIDNPFMNAFVMQGGEMRIHSGLFTGLESVEELQGVLAHEIGHITGGHIVRIRQRQKALKPIKALYYTVGFVSLVAAIATDADDRYVENRRRQDPLGHTQRGDVFFPLPDGRYADPVLQSLLRFNRRQELYADQAAITLLEKSCQTGAGLEEVLRRLEPQELHPEAIYRPYLSTHPEPYERLTAIAGREADDETCTGPSVAEALTLADRFTRIRAKIIGFSERQSVVSSYFKPGDGSFAAHYARAHALARAGDIEAALAEIDGLREDDPYVNQVRAAFLVRLGRFSEARTMISKARQALPNDTLISLSQAQILLADEDLPLPLVSDAVAALRIASQDEPDNPLVWRQLATAHFRADRETDARLAMAEAYVLEGDTAAARYNANQVIEESEDGSAQFLRARDILYQFE